MPGIGAHYHFHLLDCLGQIAMLTGRKLKWDPVKMELSGDAAASKLLSREQRMPWHLA